MHDDPDERDEYQEWADSQLMEEHAAHPERFHRYTILPGRRVATTEEIPAASDPITLNRGDSGTGAAGNIQAHRP